MDCRVVEGQRPRADHVRLLKGPGEYTTDILEGQPHARVSEAIWSMTAVRLQGRSDTNPQVWIPVRCEPRAQDAVLATPTESSSVPPRSGSPDRRAGCGASPPPVSGHVAYR